MPAAGRPDLHVVARFLDRLAGPGAGSLTRSRLQRAVGLNYDLFRRYLDLVVAKGLVERLPGPPESFQLTSKGRSTLAELARWLDDLFSSRF